MNIRDVIENELCLGCGICTYYGYSVLYDRKKGIHKPLLEKKVDDTLTDIYDICPGKGYKINKMGKELCDSDNYCIELGYYLKNYMLHSSNEVVLNNASSGGIITEILMYLLKNKIVDKVLVTKFIYSENGPVAKAFLTDKVSEIYLSQGSKYCPVDISTSLRQIIDFDDSVAIVLPPCYVAAIRRLQIYDNALKSKIKFIISNYCGGYKDYRQINYLIKKYGFDLKTVEYFRFRGGGQPGSMIIKSPNKQISIKYPLYMGETGYSKMLRCHFCVDATGELSDISCGDAWLDYALKDKYPWSVITTRTKNGDNVIRKMIDYGIIISKNISLNEVIESQKININSKKYRQSTRRRIYRSIGFKLPDFDGGYKKEYTSIMTEVIVFFKHRLNYIMQKAGLYRIIKKTGVIEN